MNFIMRIILKKYTYRYILFSIFFFKCVYFNTFYNAEESFEKALQIIENSPIVDDNSSLPSEAVMFLDKTISNCNIVLDKYPNSKYVDKAYLLTGISFFYKQLYQSSIDKFSSIIDSDNLEIKSKAILWTAYAFLKSGNLDKAADYLKMVQPKDLNNENSYIYYNIKAEMYEVNNDLKEAYSNYLLASQETSRSSRKNYIYRKLIKLSEDSNDLVSKINFIELLEQYVEEPNKIKDLKVEWMETKDRLGEYESIIEQVDLIIDNPIFTAMRPQLMIYKAKAYKKNQKKVLAKQVLNEIVDEFTRKDETSEAYYQLGLFSLFEDFDIQKAEEYFDKSISEKSRSKYGKKSKVLNEKIEKYVELKEDYEYFKNKADTDSNSDKSQPVDDGLVKEKSMNVKLPAVNDEVLLDSLLFNMGQILYFNFNQIDSALKRYQYILDEYPKSKYKSQLLSIINYHNGGSLSFNQEGLSQESERLDSLSVKRDEAWNFSDIQESLKLFNLMYEEYSDSIALFNAGYIYDHFLYDIEKAVAVYYQLQDRYVNHPKAEYINNRLIELDISISTLINENNQKIDLYDAYNLIKDGDLDSANKRFENIEVNRRDPIFKTVKDLSSYIDAYILMQQDYLKVEGGLKDSLVFHMAEIDYYYFNRPDSAFLKFENIFKKFPNSDYVNQASWIMSREIDKYNKDSIDYSLVDTSKISFYNPIDDWDIKKIKSEYEKLNNLYSNFKDKGAKDD